MPDIKNHRVIFAYSNYESAKTYINSNQYSDVVFFTYDTGDIWKNGTLYASYSRALSYTEAAYNTIYNTLKESENKMSLYVATTEGERATAKDVETAAIPNALYQTDDYSYLFYDPHADAVRRLVFTPQVPVTVSTSFASEETTLYSKAQELGWTDSGLNANDYPGNSTTGTIVRITIDGANTYFYTVGGSGGGGFDEKYLIHSTDNEVTLNTVRTDLGNKIPYVDDVTYTANIGRRLTFNNGTAVGSGNATVTLSSANIQGSNNYTINFPAQGGTMALAENTVPWASTNRDMSVQYSCLYDGNNTVAVISNTGYLKSGNGITTYIGRPDPNNTSYKYVRLSPYIPASSDDAQKYYGTGFNGNNENQIFTGNIATKQYTDSIYNDAVTNVFNIINNSYSSKITNDSDKYYLLGAYFFTENGEINGHNSYMYVQKYNDESGAQHYKGGPYFRGDMLYYTSDARFKTDIEPAVAELDDSIKQQLANPDIIKSFRYAASGSKGYGFIAQELEKILPSVVDTDSLGTMSVNYNSALSAVLAAALDKIDKLEIKIQQLEQKYEIV